LDVNESKLRNGELENIEDLAIDFGLVLGLDFGVVAVSVAQLSQLKSSIS
jgi:hypothetical protein